MEESRVERLLRLAEEAAVGGDIELAYALTGIADTALEMRKQETRELEKIAADDE